MGNIKLVQVLLLTVIMVLVVSCAGQAPAATTAATPTATSAPTTTAAPTATAAWKPEKTITWVIMNAPGTSFDLYSRAIAPVMKKYTGQEIEVKNVTGAGGLVALMQLYRSKGDGYTIGLVDTERRTSESVLAKQEYNIEDIGWVGAINAYYGNVGVAAEGPYKSIADIIKTSEQRPIKISLADVAPYEAIAPQLLGIKSVSYVTGYAGSVDSVLASVKGESDVTFYGETTYLDYIKAGRIKVLLHGGPTESPIFKAAGLSIPNAGKDYPALTALLNVRALVVPPGTPANIQAFYEDALMKSLKEPSLLKWSEDAKMPLQAITAKEFQVMKKNLTDLWIKYKDILVKYGVK